MKWFGELRQSITDFDRIHNAIREISPLKSMVEEIPQIERVVIFGVRWTSPIQLLFESVIAVLLAERGIEVVYFADFSGYFLHWDTYTVWSGKSVLNPSRSLVWKILRLINVNKLMEGMRKFGVKVVDIGAFARGKNLDVVWEKDVIEKYAYQSLVRYRTSPWVDTSDSMWETMLRNARISYSIGILIADLLAPDLYISSHGIYSTWGPAYLVVKQKGTNTLVWGKGSYVTSTVRLSTGPLQVMSVNDRDGRIAVGELEKQKVNEYMNGRLALRYGDSKVYQPSVSNIIPRQGYRLRVCVFPNVSWDGEIQERNILYPTIGDWLVETIEVLSRNRECQVVVRFHPSEAVVMRGSRFYDLIKSRLEIVPDNVVFVHPEDPVNSYSLLDECDAVVFYTSFIGLEAAYKGLPVIGGGCSPFWGLGGVIEPRSREEYLDLLANMDEVVKRYDREKALSGVYRAIYYYIFRKHFYWPVFGGEPEVELDSSISRFLREVVLQ